MRGGALEDTMKALILGIIILFGVIFSVLPTGLGWGKDVLVFLKGALPVIAAFIGLISVFIGIADIKDMNEAKHEDGEGFRQAEKIAAKKAPPPRTPSCLRGLWGGEGNTQYLLIKDDGDPAFP
ncbi:hypothetical protein Holit_02023 [Hollandina sp. SP2]